MASAGIKKDGVLRGTYVLFIRGRWTIRFESSLKRFLMFSAVVFCSFAAAVRRGAALLQVIVLLLPARAS
jgi:hypothetical protein